MNTTTAEPTTTAEYSPGKTSTENEIARIFNLQRANQYRIARTSANERRKKLADLEKAFLSSREEIREALYNDFRKHPSEVDLTEIYPVVSDIKYARAHLRKWMRPKKVGTPMAQIGTSSYIHYEPKGVVLVISPWNFPVNLSFGPMISAIAAGNCVMLKPSEHTPHASAIMKRIISELFDEAEVAVVEGGVQESTQLLKLPFNHIFFTGSPEIGKIVMKAAAENLASVTLELGGKSPVIVDKNCNLKTAAMRIGFGKWMNNGQVCIAPDHVYVHESAAEEFVGLLKQNIKDSYGEDPSVSPSYNRIVNRNHHRRISSYVDDAVSKGAIIEYGGTTDPDQDYFEPTILTKVPATSGISENEIFGPVLPVYVYKELEEVISEINSGEKPLALYIYSNNKRNVTTIIQETRAGGTVVNHSGIHFFNNNLPFGGSNNSGIGKGNGFFGFEAFSNQRAVLKQWAPVSGLDFMGPPFDDFKQKLINLTIKWF